MRVVLQRVTQARVEGESVSVIQLPIHDRQKLFLQYSASLYTIFEGANFAVQGEVVGSVGRGLCLLVGIHKTDTPDDLEWM